MTTGTDDVATARESARTALHQIRGRLELVLQDDGCRLSLPLREALGDIVASVASLETSLRELERCWPTAIEVPLPRRAGA